MARLEPLSYSSPFSFEYAGPLSRFVATLIDGALLSLCSWLVSVHLHLIPALDADTAGVPYQDVGVAQWLAHLTGYTTVARIALAGLLINVAYYTVLLSAGGRTIGAFITRIRIVDTDGGAVFPPAAIVRTLWVNLSAVLFVIAVLGDVPALLLACGFAGTIVDLGSLMAVWDERRQTFQDKLAGTVVVKAGWLPDRSHA
jgi:uncharacterized RDD family membrane protein YckC